MKLHMRHCIVDLSLVVGSKCNHEKNRCADAIVEVISLSASFILIIALYFHYVFMLICGSLDQSYFPLFRSSASHTRSLSLSVILLVSSLSLLFHHT